MKKLFKYLLVFALVAPLNAHAANETTTPYDTVTQGKSTAAHKYYVFNINAGAGNPRMRANFSTGKLEFSNDGVNYENFAADADSIAAIPSLAIDWSLAAIHTKTLGANSTFTFSNVGTKRKIIIVRLTNTASNYTVTWPTVKWSGGTPPVQTIGAKTDVYTFIYDGTDIHGSVVQNMF